LLISYPIIVKPYSSNALRKYPDALYIYERHTAIRGLCMGASSPIVENDDRGTGIRMIKKELKDLHYWYTSPSTYTQRYDVSIASPPSRGVTVSLTIKLLISSFFQAVVPLLNL
jgi:hypothetical protein